MPPTLILIRHGEALHNVSSDWTIPDPSLSELGVKQCEELEESLKNSKVGNEVELIISSAMRRTLQTTVLGLGWLIEERKIKVIPDAKWQENSHHPCDTGSPISSMAAEFPHIDFSPVDARYPDKTSNPETNIYAFTKRAVLDRGQLALKDLYHRPEKVIAVVSHSGFLRCAISRRRFFNADWRVFDFDEQAMEESKKNGEGVDGNGLFLLKEWPETEEKGGGLGKSQKGKQDILPDDFPPDDVDKTHKEPVEQVPASSA